ncbi:MAG: tRNA lysidine(34) synthetase TilS [Gammaproteobacteria bacterium]
MTLYSEIIESRLAPLEPLKQVYVAYSGGVDSHVLLHLAAAAEAVRTKLVAVYVHHGLQPEADDWARHTRATADALGADFILLRVNAAAGKGESPEEAARNARYSALKELTGVDEAVLVAHHLEDQLETVMLQLLRGCGLRGLSGMPERADFGRGVLLRPLLTVSRQAITEYAVKHRLAYVTDPSNQSSDFDRNFLRNAVLPLLKRRWPGCAASVARTARHCAEAETLLAGLANDAFIRIHDPADNTLNIRRLKTIDRAKQRLVVRHWFMKNDLKMPSRGIVEHLLDQVVDALESRQPELMSQGCRFRRYRDKLYCLKHSESDTDTGTDYVWPQGQSAVAIGTHRILSCRLSSSGIPVERWRNARVLVKFRSGGEVIGLPGRRGHHSLKKLYQEAGIPPWERMRIPLIYLNGTLAAVGDKWISSDFYGTKKDACIRLTVRELEPNAKDHDEMCIVD